MNEVVSRCLDRTGQARVIFDKLLAWLKATKGGVELIVLVENTTQRRFWALQAGKEFFLLEDISCLGQSGKLVFAPLADYSVEKPESPA